MSGKTISPRHGRVSTPKSRAVFAREMGLLPDDSVAFSLESGKFFPALTGGLQDPLAREDVANREPPPDGKIASAGYPAAAVLDEPRPDWQKHEVRAGEKFTVSWDYSAAHPSRRWNYFLTKPGWDSSTPLARRDFDDKPFYKVENTLQPHGQHSAELMPPRPTVHEFILPNQQGYQVLLAVWEVCNTAAAFYQVIDLLMTGAAEGQAPTAPPNVTVSNVTSSTIGLSWLPSMAGSGSQVEKYTIYRDGLAYVVVTDLSALEYLDTQLRADTEYTYMISATDNQGRESLPSSIVKARTWGAGGQIPPPTAPSNLHAMGLTETSITLMWGPSVTARGILYLVYRDGEEVARLPQRTLEFTDHGLTPGTTYTYVVKAINTVSEYSPPSNEVTARTEGAPVAEPWNPNSVFYEVGDQVSYQGGLYECYQRHTSNSGWSPTAAFVLWRPVASRGR